MPPPVIAIVGESGSGKTTLLCGVLAALSRRGFRVGAVKHSGGFDDPDLPGKDSRRLREAGAVGVVLGCAERTVVFREHPKGEPTLAHRLRLLPSCDLVLVESYGAAEIPAIEVVRAGARLHRAGDRLVALASDGPVEGASVPVLPLGEPGAVAEWILRFCRVKVPAG
ncbi:MAG TPA: molybdopterin-guanine dinucleotide biosynthesis protein B [Planctomycetota bacterium]|nr:molybdopterin-guanine dinucleotide biosynthesis protein B [Planctomycetota bacterium]